MNHILKSIGGITYRCLKCKKIFKAHHSWTYGTYPYNLLKTSGNLNAEYNLKYSQCIISTKEWKMRELLK